MQILNLLEHIRTLTKKRMFRCSLTVARYVHERNLRRCLDERGLEWEMIGLLKAANKAGK